jgi:hypothetical protein
LESATKAERHRQRAARTGFVAGKRIWMPEEDRVIRLRYPNYDTIRAARPTRTFDAIRGRAQMLQIKKAARVDGCYLMTNERSR